MSEHAVIITGANGFIGNELVHYFAERQYKVYALARNTPPEMPANAEFIQYDLAKEILNEYIFSRADFVIHCAYAKHSGKKNDIDMTNVLGAKRLVDVVKKYNVKKVVFLSSLSAHEGALSYYGNHKMFLEDVFNTGNNLILKPGLVIGNGGLYKTIAEIISKSKFIPMIGGGGQPVHSVYIDDLANIILTGLENDTRGIYPVGEPVAITMKEFYKAVSSKLGKKSVFVPFPYWCAELLIFTAGLVGLKIPITKENILGLKCNRKYDMTETLKTFGVKLKTYIESIDSLLSQKQKAEK